MRNIGSQVPVPPPHLITYRGGVHIWIIDKLMHNQNVDRAPLKKIAIVLISNQKPGDWCWKSAAFFSRKTGSFKTATCVV